MNIESNRLSQLEVARQILRLTDEAVDYNTCSERELYHAAERLAELVMSAHNASTLDAQKHPEYIPADDPDAGLVALRNTWNLPPWVVNPRPRVQIEPYIPTSYAPAGGASEF